MTRPDHATSPTTTASARARRSFDGVVASYIHALAADSRSRSGSSTSPRGVRIAGAGTR
jgi:hypothetical protein